MPSRKSSISSNQSKNIQINNLPKLSITSINSIPKIHSAKTITNNYLNIKQSKKLSLNDFPKNKENLNDKIFEYLTKNSQFSNDLSQLSNDLFKKEKKKEFKEGIKKRKNISKMSKNLQKNWFVTKIPSMHKV